MRIGDFESEIYLIKMFYLRFFSSSLSWFYKFNKNSGDLNLFLSIELPHRLSQNITLNLFQIKNNFIVHKINKWILSLILSLNFKLGL